MKRTLLAGTALATAAMLASSPASAEIKVSAFLDFQASVGGDDDKANALAQGGGFATNAEVHFKGSGKTDAGLEYGFTIEMEGDADTNTKNPDTAGSADADGDVDEASIYISGAFGKILMGANDDAADIEIDGCVNCTYGMLDAGEAGDLLASLRSSSAKTEPKLDEASDAPMVMYTTPRVGGVQVNVSYMPNNGTFQSLWGGNINTSHKFGGVGIKLNFTGVHAGLEVPASATKDNALNGYNVGMALDFEGFKFEVGYMREHSGESAVDQRTARTVGVAPDGSFKAGGNKAIIGDDDESWAIGIGYGQGPWSVGVGYVSSEEFNSNDQWEAWAVGGKYVIAEGLYTSIGFTFAEDTVGGGKDGQAGSPSTTDVWNGTLTVGMAF